MNPSHSSAHAPPLSSINAIGAGRGRRSPPFETTPLPRSRGFLRPPKSPRRYPWTMAWVTHSNVLRTNPVEAKSKSGSWCKVLCCFIMLLQGHVALNSTKPGWVLVGASQKFRCLGNNAYNKIELTFCVAQGMHWQSHNRHLLSWCCVQISARSFGTKDGPQPQDSLNTLRRLICPCGSRSKPQSISRCS